MKCIVLCLKIKNRLKDNINEAITITRSGQDILICPPDIKQPFIEMVR
jgi:hypothetical protein